MSNSIINLYNQISLTETFKSEKLFLFRLILIRNCDMNRKVAKSHGDTK